MLKEKTLSQQNKVKIFLEVNFYLVLHFQEIKQALHLPIEQIKVEQVLQTTNSDSESKTISVEQKIFSGFKGLNTFKKSELRNSKSKSFFKKAEQQTILDTASAYFDLIFKSKNENLIYQMLIYLKDK